MPYLVDVMDPSKISDMNFPPKSFGSKAATIKYAAGLKKTLPAHKLITVRKK